MSERVLPIADPPLPSSVGIDPAHQIDFLSRHYLAEPDGFVRDGGSKVKLVIGGMGAGKTHFLVALEEIAQGGGFLTARVDAGHTQLGGFDLVYQAAVREVDFMGLARRYCAQLVEELGYGHVHLDERLTLTQWAILSGHDAGQMRVRVSDALHQRLCERSTLDYGYGLGLLRLCEEAAWGTDEPSESGLLEHWLRGGRVSVRDCNRMRLGTSADRFRSRLWLRSLLHFIRMVGFAGLVVLVDGMEAVVDVRPRAKSAPLGTNESRETWASFVQSVPDGPRYTKQRRDDLYETVRQLIDDMGLLPGFLLVLAGPPALVGADNAKTGFRSYPALASRMANEVETIELNRFADEIVLERLWAADPEAGRTLADLLVSAVIPEADDRLRQRALDAARTQWAVRDVTVSAVRRSVLAVLATVRQEQVRTDSMEPEVWSGVE